MTDKLKPEPTREEIIDWYKQQIELHTLRHELGRLQSDILKFKAEELQAAAFISQFQEEQKESSESETSSQN